MFRARLGRALSWSPHLAQDDGARSAAVGPVLRGIITYLWTKLNRIYPDLSHDSYVDDPLIPRHGKGER